MARQGKRLIKRLICGATFAVLIIAIAAIVGIAVSANSNEEVLRAQIIELNDTRAELPSSSSDDRDTALLKADQALADTQDALRQAAGSRDTSSAAAIVLIALTAIAVISLMTFYLYRAVARPFAKLEGFAEEVAAGNLDVPLAYERSNPFGKFTWAFDNLRCELSRAKKDEEQAREDYKTALASLSHDLRTPLASLRAYAETLEMGLIDSDAERAEYERAIMRKCDEVSSLVEDLFQHALSDMDRISVQCRPVQAARIIERCASDSAGLVRISCKRLEDAIVQADEMRLSIISSETRSNMQAGRRLRSRLQLKTGCMRSRFGISALACRLRIFRLPSSVFSGDPMCPTSRDPDSDFSFPRTWRSVWEGICAWKTPTRGLR